MSDWQVGDLALCVRGGYISGLSIPGYQFPTTGKIYQVVRVGWLGFFAGPNLALWLLDAPVNYNERVWPAYRFRKIPPHTPDAEDDETIRLLNGAPVLEPVS